ncbi:MAG TPA: phosphonoacetaldehyde hydrolase [Desulfuromonadales bacterium]|nr:phosphonoacetaldehyde hydrolase [Desulfuromonadales bacterium]
MADTFRSKYSGPLKAVILDWAGTIVDYGCCAPAETFIELFRRRGVTVSMEQAREPMGTPKRTHLEMIAAMEPVAQQWHHHHGTPLTTDNIDELYKQFTPLQISALPRYSNLIPGTQEAVAEFRKRGLKIGTTTGYTMEMMQVVTAEAERQGFAADVTVCADEVPSGRPHPWMCFKAAMAMQVYPMAAIVKIGDTVPDIAEGLNAGNWTVAVAKTGNEVGLTEEVLNSLPNEEQQRLVAVARERLWAAGAHYVVDSIDDVPSLLDEINGRLAAGETP